MPQHVPPVAKVVEACLKLDRIALDLYNNIQDRTENPDEQLVWKTLADHERSHITFWENLHTLSLSGEVPEIFEDPDGESLELFQILPKVEELRERYFKKTDTANAFLLAFGLEFYLLHPALSSLFLFAGAYPGWLSLPVSYDTHLEYFITSFRRQVSRSPALDLMGEALDKLWRQNRVLQRLGTTDSLTGLLNRRGFFNMVQPLAHMASRSGETVGMLMADIDNFKAINDLHGHLAGDETLKTIGAVLQRSVRLSDIVGRYGGEEFIIFFPGIQRHSLLSIAEKIRETVQTETARSRPCTLSIGLAESAVAGEVMRSVLDLIKKADQRLYEAKEKGKNQVRV